MSSGAIEESLPTPLPISKSLPPLELHDIPEEKVRKSRSPSASKLAADGNILKLTASGIAQLTSEPESLPVSAARRSSIPGPGELLQSPRFERRGSASDANRPKIDHRLSHPEVNSTPASMHKRPDLSSRASSTPPIASNRMPTYSKPPALQTSPKRKAENPGGRLDLLDLNGVRTPASAGKPATDLPSPTPQEMPLPLPPMSIPTYLQLELSSTRPSPLYIYRPTNSDTPYESSQIKFERLLNFLLLPPQLEQVLFFGSFACLDALLYTFTILPLRFFKALAILVGWWFQVLAKEVRFVGGFVWHGAGRMWSRQRESGLDTPARSRSVSRVRRSETSAQSSYQSQPLRTQSANQGLNKSLNMDKFKAELARKNRAGWTRRHHRAKSQPSTLSSNHKADLLQGLVIICSCVILLKLDASRMYHSIKGQAAIKLYVIYNLLEVCDKLFSALGQDIFECLFSDETLERAADGRSKVIRPLWMFLLALIYNVIHAAALFYQVITLNVAVNSYSNALLTLLLSNQFVEIKGSVFKKIEKDNLFQMTCADVVERFTLWFMLVIIALRNIVEVGGLSVLSGEIPSGNMNVPVRGSSVFTNFTILPDWTGEVVSPFIMVIGSEMLVDWIKHAYISKFNGVKPAVYQRYLDILAKDYYTNAFVNQNLTKRLGLPVIPLSCLFIRSSVQTYNMFLATHIPPPIPSTTALALESPAGPAPITTAALAHFDDLIRRALGRSTFNIPSPYPSSCYLPDADTVIASLTMLTFFLVAYLVLLAAKLVLGMLLLKFARNRYSDMKTRENVVYEIGGKRLGRWGMVEMDEAKRKWFYEDDPETLTKLREKERVGREKAEKAAGENFEKISRYEMSAKRIW
ncbi:eukaryotic membrane protein family-domain-containing protein [Calycina marina]|uniref:Eukaryotic membrane protein family-domain-containing protein n=1 Tax=Calycina marina TaxID=1763456 RepID=A0A9P8CE68_9HELO|nr:eukaryotic membrane protein family-domain-containing protein [Calycina marina]